MNPALRPNERHGVFVEYSLELYTNNRNNIVAAYSPHLGLTGYGESDDEAVSSFEEVLSVFVKLSQQMGCLEDNLNRVDVQWDYMSIADDQLVSWSCTSSTKKEAQLAI